MHLLKSTSKGSLDTDTINKNPFGGKAVTDLISIQDNDPETTAVVEDLQQQLSSQILKLQGLKEINS